MKKYFSSIMLLLISVITLSQPKSSSILTEGAKLLFKNTKSKLTDNEKNWLFKQLNFTLSADKKNFMSGEYEVTVLPYITDLNKDGIEEVFIVMQSTALFGNTGEDFVLYIKNSNGKLEHHNEIGGGIAMIIIPSKKGYPDIAIGGPGFKFPLYKWDGKKYKYFKEIKDEDIQKGKIKYTGVEESSKLYIESF
jgi:hypothetical protein